MDGRAPLGAALQQPSRERPFERRTGRAETFKENATVRACVKSLHSPDADDLVTWMPDDEAVFGFLLQAMIGPIDEEGAEAFDIIVCSPGWIARDMSDTGIRSGEHLLLMTRYDHRLLLRYLEKRVHSCEAPTWPELAQQISRLGSWEFDGYRPASSTLVEG